VVFGCFSCVLTWFVHFGVLDKVVSLTLKLRITTVIIMFYRLYSKRLHTQYKPESKTVADNTGINVGKIVFTYCSPLSIVVDFQTSHGSQDTPAQSDFDI